MLLLNCSSSCTGFLKKITNFPFASRIYPIVFLRIWKLCDPLNTDPFLIMWSRKKIYLYSFSVISWLELRPRIPFTLTSNSYTNMHLVFFVPTCETSVQQVLGSMNAGFQISTAETPPKCIHKMCFTFLKPFKRKDLFEETKKAMDVITTDILEFFLSTLANSRNW